MVKERKNILEHFSKELDVGLLLFLKTVVSHLKIYLSNLSHWDQCSSQILEQSVKNNSSKGVRLHVPLENSPKLCGCILEATETRKDVSFLVSFCPVFIQI